MVGIVTPPNGLSKKMLLIRPTVMMCSFESISPSLQKYYTQRHDLC
jgi:hypothetical protein